MLTEKGMYPARYANRTCLKYNVYNLQFNNYVGFRAQTLQARSRSRSLLLTVNSVAMSLSLISDASFHCLWSSSTFCFTEIICTTNSELIQLNMQHILETRKAHNVRIYDIYSGNTKST